MEVDRTENGLAVISVHCGEFRLELPVESFKETWDGGSAWVAKLRDHNIVAQGESRGESITNLHQAVLANFLIRLAL